MKFFILYLVRACTYALSATIQTETSNPPRHTDSENIHTSLIMVEYAIKVLEDDEHFNAGHFFSQVPDTLASGLIECKVIVCLRFPVQYV